MSNASASPGFPVYVTGSSEEPRALIVLQEAFGVNEHIRSVADRFSDSGYFTVAQHLFHRSGVTDIPYDDVDRAIATLSELSEGGLRNDLDATTDFLGTLGYGAACIGVVGFCMGGSVAFYAATLRSIGAAVSFYGGGITKGRMGLAPLIDLAPELTVPWLGLYGDLDTGIPVVEVEALREATKELNVATDIVRYPNAGHGFHCDARASAFNEDAALDGRRRALEFLAAHLSEK